MEFGVFLPTYGPLSTVEGIRRVALAAERLRFDFVALCDHIFIEPEAGRTHINVGAVDHYPTTLSSANWYDAVSTLGYVSALTERVKLLTNIYLLPLRHPLVTARAMATIDHLSHGRLRLGIGVGWFKKEYVTLQVSWNERGKIADEYVEALKALWTQEVASFHGKYTSFEGIHFYPKPVQKPHPPFWVGGYVNDGIRIDSHPKVLRRVARIAEAWVPSIARPDELRSGIEIIKKFCKEIGRSSDSIRVVSQHLVSIGANESEALSKAEATLRTRFGTLQMGLNRNLVGNSSRIASRIETYLESGATDFVLGFISKDLEALLSDMEQFARDVRSSFN